MVSDGTCQEPLTSGGYDTEVEDYNKMKKSVEENKGFYVGRYETGKDENNKAVVKKNKPVYREIKWGNSMTDSAGGAVELARNFSQEQEYKNLTSTLCYGVQWDAAMQFIDNNYMNGECSETSYVRNSAVKGNYAAEAPINTGSNENYKIKNIYDMAGNAFEWTMESYNNTHRFLRGGGYTSGTNSYPASTRMWMTPEASPTYTGLRIALYLYNQNLELIEQKGHD